MNTEEVAARLYRLYSTLSDIKQIRMANTYTTRLINRCWYADKPYLVGLASFYQGMALSTHLIVDNE